MDHAERGAGGEKITPGEVEVRSTPAEGFAVTKDLQLLAALNTVISEPLAQEGLAREVIRRIQVMREKMQITTWTTGSQSSSVLVMG